MCDIPALFTSIDSRACEASLAIVSFTWFWSVTSQAWAWAVPWQP